MRLKAKYKNFIQLSGLYFFSIALAFYVLKYLLGKGSNIFEWDLMLLSGLLLLVLGIYLSMSLPARLDFSLNRLFRRGVLQVSESKFEEVKKRIDSKSDKWAIVGALSVGISILIAFIITFGLSYPRIKIPLTVIEILGGLTAGWYLGRMAFNGTIGLQLKKEGVPISAIPGHLDNAAGLKPIGDFYFFQAMVAAMPAIYLSIWLILITLWPYGGLRYGYWKESYRMLLPIALIFEILAFIVPISLIHREMQRQKVDYLKRADSMGKEIVECETRLTRMNDCEQYNMLKDKFAGMIKKYEDYEHMPTWPVDTKTRRRFTRNNIFLFIPLFGNLLKDSPMWQSLMKSLADLIKNL